jgi:hypothetical protein
LVKAIKAPGGLIFDEKAIFDFDQGVMSVSRELFPHSATRAIVAQPAQVALVIVNSLSRRPAQARQLALQELRDKVWPKDRSSIEPPHKFKGADEIRTHDNVLPVAFAQSRQSDFKKLRDDNVVPPAFVAPSCGGANVPPARLGRAAFSPESGTLAQKLRTLLNRGETSTFATTRVDETFCPLKCSSIGIRRNQIVSQPARLRSVNFIGDKIGESAPAQEKAGVESRTRVTMYSRQHSPIRSLNSACVSVARP